MCKIVFVYVESIKQAIDHHFVALTTTTITVIVIPMA